MSTTSKGPALTAIGEVLYRQVKPEWFAEQDEPTSQAFRPRPTDKGMLSVDRSSLTTPKDSFVLATTQPPAGFGLTSAGVWGVSIEEVHGVALTAHEDPVVATTDKPANPAHCVVDFTGRNDKQARSLGRVLKHYAHQRGRLYGP